VAWWFVPFSQKKRTNPSAYSSTNPHHSASIREATYHLRRGRAAEPFAPSNWEDSSAKSPRKRKPKKTTQKKRNEEPPLSVKWKKRGGSQATKGSAWTLGVTEVVVV